PPPLWIASVGPAGRPASQHDTTREGEQQCPCRGGGAPGFRARRTDLPRRGAPPALRTGETPCTVEGCPGLHEAASGRGGGPLRVTETRSRRADGRTLDVDGIDGGDRRAQGKPAGAV